MTRCFSPFPPANVELFGHRFCPGWLVYVWGGHHCNRMPHCECGKTFPQENFAKEDWRDHLSDELRAEQLLGLGVPL